MQARVSREGDKVSIEGGMGFSPAEYADSGRGCQTRILQVLGGIPQNCR